MPRKPEVIPVAEPTQPSARHPAPPVSVPQCEFDLPRVISSVKACCDVDGATVIEVALPLRSGAKSVALEMAAAGNHRAVRDLEEGDPTEIFAETMKRDAKNIAGALHKALPPKTWKILQNLISNWK